MHRPRSATPALKGLAARAAAPRPAPSPAAADDGAHCGLCPIGIGENHRHLLDLVERRMVCVCETCWSMHSGDAEYRPAGSRTLWLPDAAVSEQIWASLQLPIGLAFLMRSGSTGQAVALYPSPAGATEAEIDVVAWGALCAANPVLDRLEPDAEGFLVNRLPAAGGPAYAIAPIDQCYKLVGLIMSRWEGISGGAAIESAVAGFFEELRGRALIAA